jgi:hypothetical protein
VREAGTTTPLPFREREGPAPQAWEGEGTKTAAPVPSPCRRSAPAVPLPERERGFAQLLLALLLLLTATAASAGVSAGTLLHHRAFKSAFVDRRDVSVWLLPGYDPQAKRYAVLYMHDGQNPFDRATGSFGTERGLDCKRQRG